jgi:CHAD domain-containing protein
MTTSTTSAHPIRSLREQVTALEAAITICLADPKAKPVHRLRTTTRRIEGQFALLSTLPSLPDYHQQTQQAKRLLKKLRRAAGNVRDIDVQMGLIEAVAPGDASMPLKKEAGRLLRKLDTDRERSSQKLMKILDRRQSDLALVLESLLDELKPVENLSLSSTELASVSQGWFKDNLPAEPKAGPDDPDYLHSIRKLAKLARYIAENGPKRAKRPRRLAESFEKLQQSGGDWHDWLVLAEIARDALGEASPLTQAFDSRSRMALTTYHRHLHEMVARTS